MRILKSILSCVGLVLLVQHVHSEQSMHNDDMKSLLQPTHPNHVNKNAYLHDLALSSQNFAQAGADEITHYFNVTTEAYLAKNVEDIEQAISEPVNDLKHEFKKAVEKVNDDNFTSNFKSNAQEKIESFWEKLVNSKFVADAKKGAGKIKERYGKKAKEMGGRIKDKWEDLTDRSLDERTSTFDDMIKFIAETANSSDPQDIEAVKMVKKKLAMDLEKKTKDQDKKRMEFIFKQYEGTLIDKDVLVKYKEVISELEEYLKKKGRWHQDDISDRIVPGKLPAEKYEKIFGEFIKIVERRDKAKTAPEEPKTTGQEQPEQPQDIADRIDGRPFPLPRAIPPPPYLLQRGNNDDEDTGFRYQSGARYEVDQQTVENYKKVIEELESYLNKRKHGDVSDRVGDERNADQERFREEIKKFQNTKFAAFFDSLANGDVDMWAKIQGKYRQAKDFFSEWTAKGQERFRRFVSDVKVKREILPCVKGAFQKLSNMSREAAEEFRKCASEPSREIVQGFDDVITELEPSAKDLNVLKGKAVGCIEEVDDREEMGGAMKRTYELFTSTARKLGKNVGRGEANESFEKVESCYKVTVDKYSHRIEEAFQSLKMCFQG